MIINDGLWLWHMALSKIATWHIDFILEKNKN
jgi:Uri superfamily endonuclease